MEHGFYHPTLGYWQTTSAPSSSILQGYPEGTIEVPLKPGVNYDYVPGSGWVETTPSATVFTPLTARQFRLALVNIAGRQLGDIDAAIAQISNPVARQNAEIEWQFASSFERDNDLVVTLSQSPALGFTPQQVDQLWQQALNTYQE